MNWTNYFIALGLPSVLVLITFILAVIFIEYDFLKRLFVLSLGLGLVFVEEWLLFGIIMVLIQAIGD